eukprot:3108964-Amphidinium_carterae.1
MTALHFVQGGTLHPVELKGPTSYELWERSFLCLRTALIMLDVATLGRIDSYMRLIKDYDARYAGQWPRIYQADCQCRGELMERLR